MTLTIVSNLIFAGLFYWLGRWHQKAISVKRYVDLYRENAPGYARGTKGQPKP
jgi:hypothetical protein